MLTKRLLYWLLNIALIAFPLGSLIFALYFYDFRPFMAVWLLALGIYAAAFIMELFQLNLADPIPRFASRFQRRHN